MHVAYLSVRLLQRDSVNTRPNLKQFNLHYRHQAAIEEICRCASRELELEAKMRSTEEEWTEQV